MSSVVASEDYFSQSDSISSRSNSPSRHMHMVICKLTDEITHLEARLARIQVMGVHSAHRKANEDNIKEMIRVRCELIGDLSARLGN